MKKLSREMRRVLKKLNRTDPQNANRMKCKIVTLVALERRRLIQVETTFASIAFPRTALAYITAAGRAAISPR